MFYYLRRSWLWRGRNILPSTFVWVDSFLLETEGGMRKTHRHSRQWGPPPGGLVNDLYPGLVMCCPFLSVCFSFLKSINRKSQIPRPTFLLLYDPFGPAWASLSSISICINAFYMQTLIFRPFWIFFPGGKRDFRVRLDGLKVGFLKSKSRYTQSGDYR